MKPVRCASRALASLAAGLALNLLAAGAASALPAPVKLLFAGQYGYHVNLTEVDNNAGPEKEDACTVASKDECQPGTIDNGPGGFWEPLSVAGAADGNIYVVDKANHRVQELTAAGKFVLMFGSEVNETTGGDVCSAEEIAKAGVTCRAGNESDGPFSVAVDPVSGDVYVAEQVAGPNGAGERVQKFTAAGQFVWEAGREVNETTHGNLCTHEEEVKAAVKCGDPGTLEIGVPPSTGVFRFEESGNLLAVGPTGTLYVGEEGRVQELTPEGQPAGEIPVESEARVDAVAVDQGENVYLYTPRSAFDEIREFDKQGGELPALTVTPEEAGAQLIYILGLAVDSAGRLAVSAEQQHEGQLRRFGGLYEASTGRLLSRFEVPGNNIAGVGFLGSGQLFAAGRLSQEVLVYEPRTIAELTTGGVSCAPGGEHETGVVFDCTVRGEVNPEGVAETEAWYGWGLTPALGKQTSKQQVATTGAFPAVIEVRPNTPFYYQLTAEDANVKVPEALSAERDSASTPLVAPNIVGTPSTLVVTPSTAVLAAELNPENARTEYFFEYAPAEEALRDCPGGRHVDCPGVESTPAGESGAYARTATTLEAVGLQAATTYSYRLFAENENEAHSKSFARTGPIASFTTAAELAPQTQTGPYENLGATGVTITGAVTPDGAPTTYAFELGVYRGEGTQFGVVASGTLEPASPGGEETLPLTGLQSGTTYAYRISITSGYIDDATHTLYGAAVQFTTSGLPAVIAPPTVLAQLPAPKIAFPGPTGAGASKRAARRCRRGYKRGKHDRCIRRRAKPKHRARRHKR